MRVTLKDPLLRKLKRLHLEEALRSGALIFKFHLVTSLSCNKEMQKNKDSQGVSKQCYPILID